MADKTIEAAVSFPHDGDDGKARKIGDIVKVSPEEFQTRGPDGDGFLRPKADAPKAS